MESRRILLTGDYHCGHHFGLMPPKWWESEEGAQGKMGRFQRALWGFATEAIDMLRPIDTLIVGGDAIDGKGEKSGGVEQRTTDRLIQGEMAAEFVNHVEAKQVRMVYGTRYHCGKEEDFERAMIDKIKAPTTIQGHGFFNFDGCTFDVKHKVGSSSVPHGRNTPLARAHVWNLLWADRKRQPKANIIARDHVHYAVFCGEPRPRPQDSWLALTVPALAYATAFGIRECEGIVDIGMVYVDVFPDGRWTWDYVLADFPEMAAEVEYL